MRYFAWQAVTEYQPRYRWKVTWPDVRNDFSGYDGKDRMGRFYVMSGGLSHGKWWWTMNHQWLKPENCIGNSGIATSAREAAREIEEMYERAKAEGWLTELRLRTA